MYKSLIKICIANIIIIIDAIKLKYSIWCGYHIQIIISHKTLIIIIIL